MNNFRKVRIFEIPLKLHDGSKFIWQALMKKLPDDAEIIGSSTDWISNVIRLKVWSESYEECALDAIGILTPLPVTDQDYIDEIFSAVKLEEAPSVRSGACSCDMAYTGLRSHKLNCPKR